MGLFDWFRSKKEGSVSAPEPEPQALGWDAITRAFETVYPGQDNPVHVAPSISPMYDLSENAAVLFGMSAYDAGAYWHLVSYGLSELFEKESDDPEVSGFGCELTVRVPKSASERPPQICFSFLEAMARAIVAGHDLEPGHTVSTGPFTGVPDDGLDALLVVADPALPEAIDTPHGSVRFLLLLGVENAVREEVLAAYDAGGGAVGWEQPIVARLREGNPNLVTPFSD